MDEVDVALLDCEITSAQEHDEPKQVFKVVVTKEYTVYNKSEARIDSLDAILAVLESEQT